MKPFKVGDRVSFAGMKGTVKNNKLYNPINREPVRVEFDSGFWLSFSYFGRITEKQTEPVLKRLVKNKKAAPREWWIHEQHLNAHSCFFPQRGKGYVNVREVK